MDESKSDRSCFCDKNCVDINGTYNKQNNGIYTCTQEKSDDEGDIHGKTYFSSRYYDLAKGLL